jgi:endoglucanase
MKLLFMVACTGAISFVAADRLTAGETALEANHRLRRTINLGNALEAPREGEWGVTIKEEYFDLAKDAGFSAVRIPICWSAHAEAAPPYTIDAEFMSRVDEVVEQARARDLAVIINVHHYDEMNADPARHLERLKSLWTQIAKHFADRSDGLYFELFNEPMGNLDGKWKEVYLQLITTIRSVSPERILIVGPSGWNSVKRLDELNDLAGEEHTIVTFHYYLPFEFTHQEAPWVPAEFRPPLGARWGSSEDQEAAQSDFQQAATWAKRHHLPLLVGEFGAYRTADMDSRIRWTRAVAREAEKHGMSWAYWELAAGGFGIYDQQTKTWRPDLLNALIEQQGDR